MTPQELSDFIRAQARALGADQVGIAPAALPSVGPGGPRDYREWVGSGMHGTMAYMARRPEARSDIRAWFPPARSVVLLAYGYAAPDSPGEGATHGRVARYALSPDYHRVLKGRLQALLERVRGAAPGARGKAFVDTSPVLERLYGRYAGLGWIGKNTMLLSRGIGSYFFLCGLALDRVLAHDEPVPDHCGTCDRCLKACPTDAFPRAWVLDARRCVAYLTIEHEGGVPEELREGVGDWVFGCDVCQEVCPYNRFALRNPAFEPRLGARQPLERLASLTDGEFEAEHGDTPLERAGRRGLARNALLAMGNSANPALRPALERHAAGPDPVLAEQARWSLERLRRTSP